MLARDWRAFVSLPFGFSVPFGDFDIFRGVVSARKHPVPGGWTARLANLRKMKPVSRVLNRASS
jgi:hypothetical protein